MFCCEVIQLFVYHKNPSGNNLSIFACTEEIDAVLLFCSIFVIDVPCIKGQFAYVSFSPKSCILFFFQRQHTVLASIHQKTCCTLLQNGLHSLLPSLIPGVTGESHKGFLKLRMGQRFFVSYIVLYFKLADPDSGIFQAESI